MSSFFYIKKRFNQVQLIDASKLGAKVKENGLQKTTLHKDDIRKIVDSAVERKDVEDFSIVVSFSEIKEKNYSFSAGQYFPIKIEYIELTKKEFEDRMTEYKEKLDYLFDHNNTLRKSIKEELNKIKYE